jgi:hypothetical protein
MAPISITTYNRVDHLRLTIESLKRCSFAEATSLYVFSDGPRPGDEYSVDVTRKYLDTVSGFAEVIIVKQPDNNLVRNFEMSRTVPLEEHGRVIKSEDDNVFSKHFLRYMNDALDFFADDDTVIGIGAYCPPTITKALGNTHEIYLSKSMGAWGWATWADRRLPSLLSPESILSRPYRDMKERGLTRDVKRRFPQLPARLRDIDDGITNAGDYKLTYYMIRSNLFFVKPTRPLVKNIGHDGTGLHCGISAKFHTEPTSRPVTVSTNTLHSYSPKIDELGSRFFTGSRHPLAKVVRYAKRYLAFIKTKST